MAPGKAFTKDDDRARAGWRRMRQLAEEDKIQVDTLLIGLIRGLTRAPSTADVLQAEAIAAATVRCRKLRARGKDDSSERRELERLLACSPFVNPEHRHELTVEPSANAEERYCEPPAELPAEQLPNIEG